MKVSIIGMGHWGGALAALVKRAGHSVDQDFGAADSGLWLIATSAGDFRGALKQARRVYKGQPIIVCTKGIEPKTYKFMSEILNEELPKSKGRVGVLSGPQFADEVIRGVPTGSTLAASSGVRKIGREVLGEFWLEETSDIIGAEICGVGKNAAAICAGFYSVAAKGENEHAMMIARVWREVADIGLKIGAKQQTFIGLCGVGDLFLSTTSMTSRNFAAGVAIAKKARPVGTVEGLNAIKGLSARAKKLRVAAPILDWFARKIP
jgi:glycerol-3-phosphate dehydrogenase (NAD(P)+)